MELHCCSSLGEYETVVANGLNVEVILLEKYAKHTFQAPCSCYESELRMDLLLFKTINMSIV